MLEFPEWLPDLPDLGNPGLTIAKNVLPQGKGYRSMGSPVAITDAINARARGAIAAVANTDIIYSYVGNATKLYSVGATSHTDVTNAGGAYTLTEKENWEFQKWGEKVVAVSIGENPQVITFGGTNFTDLAGSPPKANHIAAINNFMVLGNINDGTHEPQTVRWSAIGDITDWTISATTQADESVIYSDNNNGGGAIQGVTGGADFGLIIQEYSTWRMVYEGSPRVFGIYEILSGVGTPCKNSITQEGSLLHMLSQEGFVQISNGSERKKIGEEKVDRYFFNDYDASYPYRVVGASDPRSSIVIWIYPGANNTNGVPNKYIAYNWLIGRWAHGEIDVEWIYRSISPGYTMEELDSVSASLDALGVTLDSDDWKGGTLRLSLYDTADKKGTFDGAALAASLETAEAQFNPGKRSFVSGVRPLIDGDAVPTIQLGTRNLLSDSVTWGSAISVNAVTGMSNFTDDHRYHRIRMNTTGEFNDAIGLDVDAQPSGGI